MEEIDRMLKEHLIESLRTEWASPVVFVLKKDGILLIYIDFRSLNSVNVRDSCSIPRMGERIN